jgi:hypothetical protein
MRRILAGQAMLWQCFGIALAMLWPKRSPQAKVDPNQSTFACGDSLPYSRSIPLCRELLSAVLGQYFYAFNLRLVHCDLS